MSTANDGSKVNRLSGGGGLAEHLLALLVYAMLAAIFTYPLVFNLDRVNGAGDPAVMVWSMAWISNALFTEPATFYGANIFHPTQNALAYTDILLPSALVSAPFFLLTGNALLGFNVVLLLTYVLSGYATFLLAKRLLRTSPYAFHAALFAGAVYALCPYRSGHITQLNSMTTYWFPLILLFMHRYLEDGRKARDLFFVGLLFSLNALSGLYYGVFAALMMAAFFVLWSLLNREAPKVRDFVQGIPIFSGFGILLALVLGPYLALSGADDHARDLATVANGSFIPPAFFVSPPQSLLLGWTPAAFGITHENFKPVYELTLYPGLAAATLAAYALIRRRASKTEALYAMLGVTIFVLSLGPRLTLGGLEIPLPYALLYEYAPGFGNLRVPARMWAIVMLCIAVLAAVGLRALLEKLGGTRAVFALAAISLFAALEFLPVLPVDRFIDRGPPGLEAAYTYLSEEDPDSVVAEVPFASRQSPFRETPRMYRSTHGFWRLVNGYASYFPEGYAATRDALYTFPEDASLAELRRLGVEYVVVHPEEYAEDGKDGEEVLRAAEAEPALERVAGDEATVLYRVEPASTENSG